MLDISRDGKGRIKISAGADDFGFPICTKPDKRQTGDLPAQCPQKIHPEDLNLHLGKFNESKATADKEKSKVYFNVSTHRTTHKAPPYVPS